MITYIGIGSTLKMKTTKVIHLTKNHTKNSLTIWDYEIGFFKYINKNKTIINCINVYPITPFIQDYITNQEFINIDFQGDTPNLFEGKLVVLI